MRPKKLAWILGAALMIRFIASLSYLSWNYPDEWYQTVEFGQWLSRGWMSYSQELDLHLRNLSWPFLLSIPLRLSGVLGFHSLRLKVFLLQFWVGCLDLGIFWGWWQLVSRQALSQRIKLLSFAWILIPAFFVHDSVRPSAEHASTIALWICLGFLARGGWILAGLASVAIFAFKYPAALLTLGIWVAVLVQRLPKRDWSALGKFFLGALTGVFLFGLVDFLVYGRFWESSWMYLQYNVFTGLGAQTFGKQSAFVYWDFFRSHWLGTLFPLGVLLVFSGIQGVIQGLKKTEAWAYAFVFYLVPHLVISHKEARFMAPLEILLLWASFKPALEFFGKRTPRWKKISPRLTAAPAIYLGVLLLRALWGETGTFNTTYLSVSRFIGPRTCAIVTSKRPSSVLFPEEVKPLSKLSLGFFPAERRRPSFAQAITTPLIWSESKAHCSSGETMLLHVDREDLAWEQEGCQRLTSHWLHGPWYSCPEKVLNSFKHQLTEKSLSFEIRKFDHLPKLGASASELLRLARAHKPQSPCHWLCGSTLGDAGESP